MRKRFKYKHDHGQSEIETIASKLCGFPGYFLIGVSWLTMSVTVLYVVMHNVLGSGEYVAQSVEDVTVFSGTESFLVLGVVSLAIWWLFSRVIRKVVLNIYQALSISIGLTKFKILLVTVGWVLFCPIVSIAWSFDSIIALLLSSCGVIVGVCSFLLEKLFMKISEN